MNFTALYRSLITFHEISLFLLFYDKVLKKYFESFHIKVARLGTIMSEDLAYFSLFEREFNSEHDKLCFIKIGLTVAELWRCEKKPDLCSFNRNDETVFHMSY